MTLCCWYALSRRSMQACCSLSTRLQRDRSSVDFEALTPRPFITLSVLARACKRVGNSKRRENFSMMQTCEGSSDMGLPVLRWPVVDVSPTASYCLTPP